MSTIIALEGAPETGKTSTIGILFALMQRKGYIILQNKKRKDSRDFFVILEKKGKKIGVSTYGDSIPLIRSKLDYFVNNSCGIMVTACRPSGPIKDFVEGYSGCSKQYIPKTVVSVEADELHSNTRDAQNILKEIENLL